MRPVTRAELLWTAVLGIVLVGSAFCLVDLHFQMRQLFVAHEHEMDVHRRLLDDQAELEMKVRRASLPGSISAGAAMLDLSGATGCGYGDARGGAGRTNRLFAGSAPRT